MQCNPNDGLIRVYMKLLARFQPYGIATIVHNSLEGSEDCLFLNVWTPFLPAKDNVNPRLRPVLFW